MKQVQLRARRPGDRERALERGVPALRRTQCDENAFVASHDSLAHMKSKLQASDVIPQVTDSAGVTSIDTCA
jgi:hypothetical protein